MRFALAYLLLLPLASPAMAACFHYGAAPVTVTGKIFERADSGPGRDKRDVRESDLYIALDRPLCVGADQADPTENNVASLQMIYPKGKNAFRKKWLDHRASVSGRLMHASTAHHHTRVLILAQKTRTVK